MKNQPYINFVMHWVIVRDRVTRLNAMSEGEQHVTLAAAAVVIVFMNGCTNAHPEIYSTTILTNYFCDIARIQRSDYRMQF